MIPLELTLSKIAEKLQRASHAQSASVLSHSFSKGEKRGTQYKYKMDSVLRNYFAGGMVRKTEAKVFEIRRDWISAPQEGAGGMRGGLWN